MKRAAFPLGLAAALVASPASAHLVTTGLGPVYDGISHFALSPEDGLTVLALAFYGGLRGAAHGRRVLFALPLAWTLGALVELPVPGGAWLLAASLLAAGGLLASEVRLPLWATTLAAGIIGLTHGLLNGAAFVEAAEGRLAGLGVGAFVFVLTALATSLVVPLRRQAVRIAVRVSGSWIAATGLLLVGWSARAGG